MTKKEIEKVINFNNDIENLELTFGFISNLLYLENDSFCINEEVDCSGDECKIKLEISLSKDDEVEFEFEEYKNAFEMMLKKQRYNI